MNHLQLKNISKSFGDFYANKNINLEIQKGEVHAILGENGAGKSTLMKIIYGLYKPNLGGEIYLNNQKIEIKSPRHANQLGIGMVHQHFMLIKPFTVLQNIILGVEPKNIFGIIDINKARSEVIQLAEKYHFKIDLDATIDSISVGMQQKVEILKALYRKAELLIFDEPTAVLTPNEISDFFSMIKNLKNENKTIIIITHKLHEIKEIADRCSIIRKGEYINTVNVNITSEEELASLMVGRTVKLKIEKSAPNPHEVIFKVTDLIVKNDKNINAVNKLNLQLKKGEIYGLSGIDGNGQSELAYALFGIKKIESGNVSINNNDITNKTSFEIYQNKLSMIPEDRQSTGLILDFKIKENFVLQKISESPFSKYALIIEKEIEKFSNALMERFDVRPNNIELPARSLSGGNQQKVILAREIANNPDVLIAFLPTRGLDVGAIEYIHQELINLRNLDKAILLISFELDEIINLSDRIGIIFKGSINKEFSFEEIQSLKNIKEEIGLYMSGGHA